MKYKIFYSTYKDKLIFLRIKLLHTGNLAWYSLVEHRTMLILLILGKCLGGFFKKPAFPSLV